MTSHVPTYADRRKEMYKNTEKDQKGGGERGTQRSRDTATEGLNKETKQIRKAM